MNPGQGGFVTEYYIPRCPDPGICRNLVSVLSAGHTWVSLPGPPRPAGVLEKAVRAVMLDHPELFRPNYYRYGIHYFLWGQWVLLEPLFPHGEWAALRRQARAWQSRVVAQLPPGASEERRLYLLADYLARQLCFREDGGAFSHTIVGAFLPGRHAAVCEGIAKAMKYLCDGAGLDCLVAVGTLQGVSHAWNVVRCGGVDRHMDVTGLLHPAAVRGTIAGAPLFFRDKEMKDYTWTPGEIPPCV